MKVRAPESGEDARAGQALLLVTMIVTGVLAVMGLAWRSTDDAALATSFSRRLGDLAAVEGRAAAAGVKLLETGTPPRGVTRFVERVRDASGTSVPVVVEYRRAASRDAGEETRWQVRARAATRREAKRLPPLPETFAPGRD